MSEKNTLCMRMALDGMLCSKTRDHESDHRFDLPPTVTVPQYYKDDCANCVDLKARLELAMRVVEIWSQAKLLNVIKGAGFYVSTKQVDEINEAIAALSSLSPEK